jgi:hypothetical protein
MRSRGFDVRLSQNNGRENLSPEVVRAVTGEHLIFRIVLDPIMYLTVRHETPRVGCVLDFPNRVKLSAQVK